MSKEYITCTNIIVAKTSNTPRIEVGNMEHVREEVKRKYKVKDFYPANCIMHIVEPDTKVAYYHHKKKKYVLASIRTFFTYLEKYDYSFDFLASFWFESYRTED